MHPNDTVENAGLEAAAKEIRALRAQVAQLQALLRTESQQRTNLRDSLAQRQHFIKHLTTAVPAALYLYNLTTRAEVFLNDRLYQVLKYPSHEIGALKPHLLAALMHPYDKRRLPMHHEKLRTAPAGSTVQMEFRLRTPEGQWKWFRGQDMVFSRDARGLAVQLLGTIQDIHEEKDFLEKLKAQKEFYENILNNIPASIAVFDEGQRCLFVNQREFPNPAINQEVTGRSYATYCQAQHWDQAVADHHQQRFRQAQASRMEVEWEETDAQPGLPEIHSQRKFHPVLSEDGAVSYVIGYGVDITPRKQMEQQLAHQQELVRQVIEANPNPICVQDETGRYVLANEAYAQLHHLSVAQLLAPPVLPAPETLQQDLALLRNGASSSYEEMCPGPNGEAAWYHTTKKPFARPDGSRYLLTISADITGLNCARLMAEESARAKEVFLANMSHEIRTPMNGIVGLARLLKKEVTTPEQTEYLNLILSNAESLLVVINDILDFAKIESHRVELEAVSFDVATAVRGTVKNLGFLAEAKGLELQASADADLLPIVEGDPVRLNQVLVNLINNAIKFTNAGEVRVSAEVSRYEADAVYLQFCVADTGIGISPDKFDQIFKSFGQASPSTTRLYGGTGLGLAICKSLIELQGGRIWVESEPGRGSRFYFTLPFRLSEQAPAVPAAAPPLPPGLLRGLRVLLAEDNQVNAFLARALLHSWEVETDVVGDGEHALACAADTPYDLVLMDIQMPRLNGLEATAQLRHVPGPNQRTPVIALTANALQSDLHAYTQAGFADWLVKPFHEQNLYAMVARHTGRHPGAVAPAVAPTLPTLQAAPAFSFERLGRLANDAGFVRKMQQLFVDTVPPQLERLRVAVTGQDWPATAQLIHPLKSTYGSLQIDDAQRCLKKMQEILEENPHPGPLLNLLSKVSQVTSQVIAVFVLQLGS